VADVHAVDVILDALVAILKAAATGAGQNVYRGRVLPLAEADQELPALLVSMAEDTPAQHKALSNVRYNDSAVTVLVKCVVQEGTEELDRAMLTLRAQVHKAIMAAPQLGSAFVIMTWPAGAQNPDTKGDANLESGVLPSIWIVQYRTNIADPTVLE
jgi:hypothetical protein